jgi:hypothetical protein
MHSTTQWGWAFAAEARGELPRGTAERWARASAPFALLPAHAGGFYTPGMVATYPGPIDLSAAGFPTGLPSAWPPATEPAQSEPTPEPTPVKPRRRLSPLAAAGVAAVAVGVAFAIASRWAK